MSDEWYDYLAKTCGAVAVSYYGPQCFKSVKELTSRGMKQVNIHSMLSEETYDDCMELIDHVMFNDYLKDLNAVVFLMLKQKGRGQKLHTLSDADRAGDVIAETRVPSHAQSDVSL